MDVDFKDERVEKLETFISAQKAELTGYWLRIGDLEHRVASLTRENAKLKMMANRFRKLVPGRHRIWELDAIAMDLEVSADLEVDNGVYKGKLEKWALLLRRFEFDLSTLRDVVRGAGNGGNRFDPNHWKGERP